AYAGTNEQGEALYWRDPEFLEKDEQGKPIKDTPNISQACPNKVETTTNIGLANRYAVGSVLPKVYGGFGTNFSWKSIDVSLTFDYQLGGKVYDSRYAGLMNPGENASSAGSNYHKDWIKSWTPENPTQEYPRWQFGDKYTTATSDRFLTSASYLNFQSFTVGYTLPKNIIKPLSRVRIYAAGENLGFISARRGLDPRYSYTGNSSMSVYSPARTISGGIQVSF
ncbi:MAG: SusC/RagA family TonB-linked outer membrane protein, partial [Muribaculaceae bacterium]|nr:SusC/RagA family TonB-linked outer membrane protein [Muribaculaceae bacterium]